MDAETRKMLRMTAAMEGEHAVVAGIGRKVKLSEMELMCLVNFAEVGIMSLFSALDGKTGEEAEASLNQHLDRIRKKFTGQNGSDGLNRLSASTAALLRSDRFSRYIA